MSRRRTVRMLLIVMVASQGFLPLGSVAVWPIAQASVQDDPWQWPADQKVERATERLKELKDVAVTFSTRDCPTTRADFEAWLDEALDIAGSLIGLQDSTRQIRKTGAGADKLRAWDTVKATGGPGGVAELTELLGRCGRRVMESDPSFRPPNQEELLRRAAQRIGEKKRSELASFGISLEEKDELGLGGGLRPPSEPPPRIGLRRRSRRSNGPSRERISPTGR